MSHKFEWEYIVQVEYGLHVRPCALVVQAVNHYQIEQAMLHHNQRSAIATSIMGMLTLGVSCNQQILFTGHILEDKLEQARLDFEKIFTEGIYQPRK